MEVHRCPCPEIMDQIGPEISGTRLLQPEQDKTPESIEYSDVHSCRRFGVY